MAIQLEAQATAGRTPMHQVNYERWWLYARRGMDLLSLFKPITLKKAVRLSP